MRLSKRQYEHREVMDLATEVDDRLSQITSQQYLKVTGANNGNLVLRCSKAPDAIECLKASLKGQQVLVGGGTTFEFQGSTKGCLVKSISGLSVAAQPIYDFIFRLTYL